MNPTIARVRNATAARSYYLVTFETVADRTRWLLRNDFHYSPLENCAARWTSPHNGIDFAHSLEMIPFAAEHCNNPRALCMRVYLHKVIPKEEDSNDPPKLRGRPPKAPSTKSSFSGETASEREFDLPVYERYSLA